MGQQQQLREQLARVEQTLSESDDPGNQKLANRPKTVNELLVTDRIRQSLADSLPNMITPERFSRLIMTVIRGNPRLAECDPMSVIAAAVQSAQLGLEPGPLDEAYIVPYWNGDRKVYEAQFQIGYRGYVALAHRSDVVIEAWPVRRGDEFSITRGSGGNKELRHSPKIEDLGDVYCYYAIAEWTAGGRDRSVFEVMNVEQIQAHRDQYSKMATRGAWVDSFDAMACKTVVRQLVRWVPKAVYLQRALAADETVRTDISPDMAEDAWANKELEFRQERDAPPAPPEDTTGPAPAGKCDVCHFDDGQHADGCPEETKS